MWNSIPCPTRFTDGAEQRSCIYLTSLNVWVILDSSLIWLRCRAPWIVDQNQSSAPQIQWNVGSYRYILSSNSKPSTLNWLSYLAIKHWPYTSIISCNTRICNELDYIIFDWARVEKWKSPILFLYAVLFLKRANITGMSGIHKQMNEFPTAAIHAKLGQPR